MAWPGPVNVLFQLCLEFYSDCLAVFKPLKSFKFVKPFLPSKAIAFQVGIKQPFYAWVTSLLVSYIII